jgi:hypothetical protein
MTGLSLSGSKEMFTKEYADPYTCCYLYYTCVYCNDSFMLVNPNNNFMAGGAIMTIRYKDPMTDEIKAIENRAEGICLNCCKEIMRRQQG